MINFQSFCTVQCSRRSYPSAMGKSPGKWIKSVLFGKKSSKSYVLKKAGTEKESFIVAKDPSSDLAAHPPSISNPEPCVINRNEQNPGIERGEIAELSNESAALFPGKQDVDAKGTGALDDAEILWQEQAAAKVQAAFRGYLARRAFWALKGIIRLQALIRGHLVRRQAIATLHCVQGIVKLQALVRGQLVRYSDARLDVQTVRSLQKTRDDMIEDSNGITRTTQLQKLSSEYAFVRKLLASTPSAMPLSLQYDPTEPNSAWNWLERWSSSRFREPLMESGIVHDFQSPKKLDNNQRVDTETSRPRRSVRRFSTVNAENNSLVSTPEYRKPKNSLKKAFGHQAESRENPQNELERVKRSLRKISASTPEANGRLEPVTEKPKHKVIKVSGSPAPDVIEQLLDDSSEKTSDPKVEVSETQEPLILLAHEPFNVLHDEQAAVEPPSVENSEKDQNISLVNEELLTMENETSKENSRTNRRRSLSSKQEYSETASQNTPTLPSYMAATASAKAKLRGQESPRFSQDGVENGIVRRHSLPYSTTGKSNSQSPRMQKLARANGKGGARVDRSLLAFRDNNERVIQAEWKR